ncbi:SRPBCC family protein [Pseudonocardia sp. RS010]|uniref:SRPBCC family protein n=1 Tax=Pseudonocardia sp. RS010 TaxID=3385979 RepID=UPI00399EEF53
MRTTIDASGPVSAPEAWDRYARPERRPEWAPYLLAVDASADRLVPGMTGRVRGPLRLSVPFTVTEVHEPGETGPGDAPAARPGTGSWAWDVRFGPIGLSLDHGVEPRGSGTRTWLTVDGPWPVLALLLPLARISLEMPVRRSS